MFSRVMTLTSVSPGGHTHGSNYHLAIATWMLHGPSEVWCPTGNSLSPLQSTKSQSSGLHSFFFLSLSLHRSFTLLVTAEFTS